MNGVRNIIVFPQGKTKGNRVCAILHTCEYLEKNGYEITYLNVDEFGKISLEELKKAIRPSTIVISIMAATNKIGIIEPIAEIGRIAHEHGVLFHTDAVQVYGHKFNAPKGIDIMYIRKGVKICSFIYGGTQERKRRAGTSNVPGIVGFIQKFYKTVDRRRLVMARKDIERVHDFLKEAQTYYLATVEGSQPRVRPFGTILLFEDRLYILTSKTKDVAKQIADK